MNIHKFLRDKPTMLLMIAGLAIACFVLLNISNIIGKILSEQEAANKYAYSAAVLVGETEQTTIDNELFDQIIGFLHDQQEANIFISIVSFVNGADTPHMGEVLVVSNEDLKLYSNRGTPIDIFSDKSGSVLIGETVSKHLSDTYGDNTAFTIGETSFEIMEVLRNDIASGLDDTLLFVWDKANEAEKKAIIEAVLSKSAYYGQFWGEFAIYIRSNSPIDEVYQTIVNTLEDDFQLETELSEASSAGSQMSYLYNYYNTAFNGASLLFAVFTVLSVTGLWITKRKREFVIRRAYGYKKSAMFKLLFADSMKIAAASLVLAAVIQVVYNVIFNVTFDITSHFLVKCGVIVLGIIIIILLMLNRALHTIDRFSVVQGLKARD